jgi:hypothetical protein
MNVFVMTVKMASSHGIVTELKRNLKLTFNLDPRIIIQKIQEVYYAIIAEKTENGH